MNKPRTIEGRWWIHGDDKPSHYGALSYDPEKGLELTVKILQDRDSDEAWSRYFQDKINNTHKVSSVIHGKDQDQKDVTLFGCGSWKGSVTSGLDTYRLIDIDSAILNFRGNSLDEPRFPSARVAYTLLNEWMGQHVFKETVVERNLAFKEGPSSGF